MLGEPLLNASEVLLNASDPLLMNAQTKTTIPELRVLLHKSMGQTRIERKYLKQVINAVVDCDNNKVYGITKMNQLIEIDIQSSEITKSMVVGRSLLTCISISEKTKVLVIGESSGYINVISSHSFVLRARIKFEEGLPIRAIALDSQGENAQILTKNGDLAKIGLKKNAVKGDYKMRERECMIMMKNGNFFLSSKNSIRLYDFSLNTLHDYTAIENIKKIYLNDTQLIAQLADTCEIFEIDSAKLIYSVKIPEQTTYISMFNDAQVLLSGTATGSVIATDVNFNSRYVELNMNSKTVTFIYFLPGSESFNTLSLDSRLSSANIPIFKPICSFKALSRSLILLNKTQIAYQEKNSVIIYDTLTYEDKIIFKMHDMSSAMLYINPSHIITTTSK